jgi:hypothetical protein
MGEEELEEFGEPFQSLSDFVALVDEEIDWRRFRLKGEDELLASVRRVRRAVLAIFHVL